MGTAAVASADDERAGRVPRFSRATVTSAVLAALALITAVTLVTLAAVRDDPAAYAAGGPGDGENGGAGNGDPIGPRWGFLRSDVVSPAAPLEPPDSAAAGSWQVVDALAEARPVISRTAVGRYSVVFPGLGVSRQRGVALATAIGGPAAAGRTGTGPNPATTGAADADTDAPSGAVTDAAAPAHCHIVDWDAVAPPPGEPGAVTGARSASGPPGRLDERVNLACRRPSGDFVDSRFSLLFTYVPEGYRPPVGDPPYAYVHLDQGGRADSRPRDAYSVSGPGMVQVHRLGTGRYAVDLVGSEFVRPGNNLQVNAAGASAVGCNVLGREVKADRQSVLVGCADGTTLADTPFVLLYTDRNALVPTGASDFAQLFTGIVRDGGPLEPAPLGDPVDAWARYSANSAGSVNTVRRTGVGVYEVVLPGVAGTPDHLSVTAYGEPTSRCSVDNWTSGFKPRDVTATVRCVDGSGRPVDSHASVAYVSAANLTGG